MKVCHDGPEGGGKGSRQAEGGKDLEGKKMGAEHEIGWILCEPSQEFTEGKAVYHGKQPGKAEGHGIAEGIEMVEETRKAAGQKKVSGAVKMAVKGGSPLQEILDPKVTSRGEFRKGGRNCLGGPHMTASDAGPQNQDPPSGLR